jgi:hypothetical protein
VKLQCNCVLSFTDPKIDISATLLFDFLEVAGSTMYCHYGQQFQKLLHLMCKEYLPKIEKVLLLGKQTCLTESGRLECLAGKYLARACLLSRNYSFSIIMFLSFGYVLEF